MTGALGYLGQTVLRKLHQDLKDNKIDSLVAMDVREASPEQQLAGVGYVKADIRDAKALEEALAAQQTTHVIHLAAIIDSQSSSREFQYQVDVEGTQNIVEACIKVKAKRIIISSSGAAYGY